MSIRDEQLRIAAIQSVISRAMLGEFEISPEDEDMDPFGMSFDSDDESS